MLINILKKEVQIQLRKKNYDFKNRNKNINGPRGLDTNTIDEQQSKKIKVEVSPSINATDEIEITSSGTSSTFICKFINCWLYICILRN